MFCQIIRIIKFVTDGSKGDEGFFHGKPENFPSLSDLVGEFSDKREYVETAANTHMVNYKTNNDGTITAKIANKRDGTKRRRIRG